MTIACPCSVNDFKKFGENWINHHKGYDLFILWTEEIMDTSIRGALYEQGQHGFSFSECRNQILERNKFVLFVDIDERLLSPLEHTDKAGYAVNIISHEKESTSLTRTIRGVNSKYRYKHFIHERVGEDIANKRGEIFESKAIIEHFGYLDVTGKIERNITLLAKEILFGDKEYGIQQLKRTLNVK